MATCGDIWPRYQMHGQLMASEEYLRVFAEEKCRGAGEQPSSEQINLPVTLHLGCIDVELGSITAIGRIWQRFPGKASAE